MRKNSENPGAGAAFQKAVAVRFQKDHDMEFILEKRIPIGTPPKDHKFDIVSSDNTIAIECKSYTWTKSGGVPSAKLRGINEAVFYLSFLPGSYRKYIVMECFWNEKRQKSLAEYYYEKNRHLLGDVKVLEYDLKTDQLKEIKAE